MIYIVGLSKTHTQTYYFLAEGSTVIEEESRAANKFGICEVYSVDVFPFFLESTAGQQEPRIISSFSDVHLPAPENKTGVVLISEQAYLRFEKAIQRRH